MLTINCYNDSTGLPLTDGTTVSIYRTTDTVGVSTPLITGVTVGGKFSSHSFYLAGGQYLAVCNDNTYENTLFYMYPSQLYTVINFLTVASQTGGGGGGTVTVVPSTQIVASCLANYYEDSGTDVASNTQSSITQSDLICTGVVSGSGLGIDYSNNAVQVTAYASAIPSTATNLRFEVNVQVAANITPPGTGGYPSNEIYQVQLYIVDVLNNLTVISEQNFSDIVQVTNTNQGNLYLSARYVAYTSTSVTSGGPNPYIDLMPQCAVLSSGGDPLQINDLFMQVEACVTAFKAVSS